MADLKISQLTSITTLTPATDVLPVVDVGGITKKITTNQILGSGGIATLASATITGDLTVDTSTLKVDSANNRVGIKQATPLHPIHVGTSDLILDSTGNLGVGTASPFGDSGYRSIDLRGSTGGEIILGSTSSKEATVTADATNGMILNTVNSTPLRFYIAGIEKARIDSSGNVGVGVSPAYKLDVLGVSAATVASGAAFRAIRSSSGDRCLIVPLGAGSGFTIQSQNAAESDFTPIIFSGSTTTFNYRTGVGTVAAGMTLDASGNLLVGVASSGNRLDIQKSTDCTALVKSTGANTNIAMDYVSNYGNHTIRKSGTAVWDYGVVNDSSATPAFKISNASAVGVQLVSGATAWTTLSDETVKDIIEPIGNAVAKVGSLRSVIGKFKTDSEGTRRSFLIAQDVKSVLPEAVDVVGENNELGLRYTEVIPLLVAAIKELTARVQTLEAR